MRADGDGLCSSLPPRTHALPGAGPCAGDWTLQYNRATTAANVSMAASTHLVQCVQRAANSGACILHIPISNFPDLDVQ